MKGETLTIDLGIYRTPGSKVFTGRPRGKDVRNRSKIDSEEANYNKVQIIIPVDIASINPSFLEEFLKTVVTKYGEAGFFEKFSFINEGKYKILEDLEEAVERLLRDENALTAHG
jgi:hypothetical protein